MKYISLWKCFIIHQTTRHCIGCPGTLNSVEKQKRPDSLPETTPVDVILEVAGYMTILGVWIFVLMHYPKLPDTIATHFNALGEADGYGGKASLFALPAISTIMFAGITILSRFPRVFNYPVKITPENALRQYTLAVRLLRILKLAVVIMFGVIAMKTVQNAGDSGSGPGLWFLPFVLGITFVPLFTYIYLASKKK